MHPVVESRGDFIDALFFESREQAHFAATCLEFGDRQGLGTFAAVEFVGFG